MYNSSQRFYLSDSRAAAALRHDGFGWGHTGDSVMLPCLRRRGLLDRLISKLKRNLNMSRLEHINITVSNPKSTARMLEQLFGWRIRWEGEGMAGAGYTVHVGGDDSYVAVYSGKDPKQTVPKSDASYATRGAMNHIGVVVDNLDKIEEKVRAMGYEAHSHADYEPGRRFYFHDDDGVEFEVVSYS